MFEIVSKKNQILIQCQILKRVSKIIVIGSCIPSNESAVKKKATGYFKKNDSNVFESE